MAEFKPIASEKMPTANPALEPILAEIKSDASLMEELSRLGLKEEELPRYLPILMTMLDERKLCAKCRGLDGCEQNAQGIIHVPSLSPSGALIGALGPCPIAERAILAEGRYIIRDFPSAWRALSITGKDFKDLRYRSFKQAYKEMKRGSLTPWIYLTGPAGSGKSRLVAAFANFSAQKGMSVAYIDARKRLCKPLSYIDDEATAFKKSIPVIQEADLLVIDGLGNENRTPYSRDELLLPLLSARGSSSSPKPTILVSDFCLDELIGLYAIYFTDRPIASKIYSLIYRNIGGKETVLDLSL